MATRKTNCCHSDGEKPSKSDRKRRKLSRIVWANVSMVFLVSFSAFWAVSLAQYPGNHAGQSPANSPIGPLLEDRDPRFYSRPGVDYRPPNPGDKEYR